MTNFTEFELIPFSLKILSSRPEGIETKNFITELRNLMNPNGEDLEILSNRNDDKFSQKVRNLKSHKTLENKGFAEFYNNKFFITKEGVEYLDKISWEDIDKFYQNIKENHNQSENSDLSSSVSNILKKNETTVKSKEHPFDNLFKTLTPQPEINKTLFKKIDELDLSVRALNCLKNENIVYVGDLIQVTENYLLKSNNFGRKSLVEVKEILSSMSLYLGMKLANWPPDNINDEILLKDYSIKKQDEIPTQTLSINILNDWPISERTYNALKNEEIIYLGDLLSIELSELLKLRNFGRKSLNEIKEFLNKENIKDFVINQTKWGEVRTELILRDKEKKISNIQIENNLRGVKKSLFKDFKKFKNGYLSVDKIIIKKDIKTTELERLILEDINNFLSLLNDKMILVFKSRYGYLNNFETLEDLGKKLNVTRERIRQYEGYINKTLIKIGKIDRYSLVEFFKKYEFVSFHKMFPQLDKNFTNTSHRNVVDITRDRLVLFIENYCGVKENYFKTPERELWNFSFDKLKEIFIFTPSGIFLDNFIEIIKDNYGYDTFTSKSAIEFLNENKFIKIVNNKIFPIKINKNEEVAHILLNYSKGLHWKEVARIGNKSYTKNKWDLERIVGDSSLSMQANPHIYLIDKGKYRLIKYLLLEVENTDQLISIAINLLKDLNAESSDLEKIHKKIVHIEKYQDLSFYDLRAIIKIFGVEKGLYHNGASGQNTISFSKDIKSISIKDKIREIIENSNDEISTQEINEKLQKTNEQLPLYTHLDTLEDESIIFKINPGTYLNFKDGIRLCDQKEVGEYLGKILDKYEFITNAFIREKINEDLGYGLSTSYYTSLVKFLAKENNWFFGFNYLSKKQERKMPVDEYIKINYDKNLSNNENYELISKNIGISRMYFNNIMHTKNIEFDTDWVHQND